MRIIPEVNGVQRTVGDARTLGVCACERKRVGVLVPLVVSPCEVIHSVGAPTMDERRLIMAVGVGGTLESFGGAPGDGAWAFAGKRE